MFPSSNALESRVDYCGTDGDWVNTGSPQFWSSRGGWNSALLVIIIISACRLDIGTTGYIDVYLEWYYIVNSFKGHFHTKHTLGPKAHLIRNYILYILASPNSHGGNLTNQKSSCISACSQSKTTVMSAIVLAHTYCLDWLKPAHLISQ